MSAGFSPGDKCGLGATLEIAFSHVDGGRGMLSGVDSALEFRHGCAERFLRSQQTGFHRADCDTQRLCYLTC